MRLGSHRLVALLALLLMIVAAPAAVAEDEPNAGAELLKWAGGRLGGKVADLGFSYVLKWAGLGGSAEAELTRQVAAMQQQLTEISSQIGRLETQVTRSQQLLECRINDTTYETRLGAHTTTFNRIRTIAEQIDQLPRLNEDERKKMHDQILIQTALVISAPKDIHDLAYGVPGVTEGLIDALSVRMKSCGFINEARLKAIKDQYNYFAALQTASCLMIKNYYNDAGMETEANRQGALCEGYANDLLSKAITTRLPNGTVYEPASQTLWRFGPFASPQNICTRKWEGGEREWKIPQEVRNENVCRQDGWMVKNYQRKGNKVVGYTLSFQMATRQRPDGFWVREHYADRWGDATSALGEMGSDWNFPWASDVQRILVGCTGDGQGARNCMNGRGFIDDNNKGDFFFWAVPPEFPTTTPRDVLARRLRVVDNRGNVYASPCDTCVARVVFVRQKTPTERFVW